MMGYKSYPLENRGLHYFFNRRLGWHTLSEAPGMVGFGGVRYSGEAFHMTPPSHEAEGPPITPTAVQFWEELKP